MKAVVSYQFMDAYTKLPKTDRAKVNLCVRYIIEETLHPGLKTWKVIDHGEIRAARVDRYIRFTFQLEKHRLILRTIGGYGLDEAH